MSMQFNDVKNLIWTMLENKKFKIIAQTEYAIKINPKMTPEILGFISKNSGCQ